MVTCPSGSEAETMARQLLEEHLVACVNIAGRIRSLFHWKGEIARESESLLLMKTRGELFDDLCRRVRELHPYEVPEVVAVPISVGNPAYLEWVRESTSRGG
jgi:periplasmic divalent cation tolerance protein